MDNAWQNFVSTGSVSDYLKYKRQEKNNSGVTGEKDVINGAVNKGLGNQGTDYRGE